jgi:hypothetical protein
MVIAFIEAYPIDCIKHIKKYLLIKEKVAEFFINHQ